MGLQEGEDSKRSDCDGEEEAETAESAECVAAGFTLMEPVPFRVPDGAAESDGVGEIVALIVPDELDGATGRLVHSMRTRLLNESAKMTLP